MLKNERVCVVQFVHGYVDDQILLGERHVLIHLGVAVIQYPLLHDTGRKTYLKCIVEIHHFTQSIEELVDTGFVVLNEGVERHHVRFFRIRRLIREILQHLGDLFESSEELILSVDGAMHVPV